MAPVLTAFPDVERLLVEGLKRPTRRTATMTSEGETYPTPLVLVERIGGSDNGITDYPEVEIAVMSRTREESQRITEEVRQEILAMGGKRVAGILVDKAVGVSSPKPLIDPVRDARRVVTRYRLAFRRARTT